MVNSMMKVEVVNFAIIVLQKKWEYCEMAAEKR